MYVGFRTHQIYILQLHPHIQICYGIILAITQTTHKWVNFFGIELGDCAYDIGLDVTCLTEELFLDSRQKLLGLHEHDTLTGEVVLEVTLGHLVEWQ